MGYFDEGPDLSGYEGEQGQVVALVSIKDALRRPAVVEMMLGTDVPDDVMDIVNEKNPIIPLPLPAPTSAVDCALHDMRGAMSMFIGDQMGYAEATLAYGVVVEVWYDATSTTPNNQASSLTGTDICGTAIVVGEGCRGMRNVEAALVAQTLMEKALALLNEQGEFNPPTDDTDIIGWTVEDDDAFDKFLDEVDAFDEAMRASGVEWDDAEWDDDTKS